MTIPVSLLNWQMLVTHFLLNSFTGSGDDGLHMYKGAYKEKFQKRLSIYYPSLKELIGEKRWLEEIAFPYLQANPPQAIVHDWACQLTEWLNQEYKHNLSPLFIPLANLETLINKTFLSPSLPPPAIEELDKGRFQLQPHFHFLSSEYPLLKYRRMILEGLTQFDIQKGDTCWIAMYQNQSGDVLLSEIDPDEKQFIEHSKRGLWKRPFLFWRRQINFCLVERERKLPNGLRDL